jgi:predicted nucleic acid-binding protein
MRWLGEAEKPSIEVAAEIAATLADLPAEPDAIDAIIAAMR